jgi:hypothetical protein
MANRHLLSVGLAGREGPPLSSETHDS